MKNLKNFFNKKRIIILSGIVAIIIIGIVVLIITCNSKKEKNDNNPLDSDIEETELAEESDDTGNESDDISDTDIFDETKSEDTINVDREDFDIEEDVEDFQTAEYPEESVIVEKSDNSGLWPKDTIPESVPECKYITIDNCYVQGDETFDYWIMSWTCTKNSYNEWLKAVSDAGFVLSAYEVGRYANGTVILDILTEDTDDSDVWVSCDITLSKPINYKNKPLNGIFPEFNKGDSTLEYYIDFDGENKMECQYSCASDWNSLVENYKKTLTENGFIIEGNKAVKTQGSKSYVVSFEDEDEIIRGLIIYYY